MGTESIAVDTPPPFTDNSRRGVDDCVKVRANKIARDPNVISGIGYDGHLSARTIEKQPAKQFRATGSAR